jgi:hypothetical protein
MAGTSYVPGTWLGVVRSGTAVLLGPDTAPALVGALWNLLADRPAVHEVLHAVSNSSGGRWPASRRSASWTSTARCASSCAAT